MLSLLLRLMFMEIGDSGRVSGRCVPSSFSCYFRRYRHMQCMFSTHLIYEQIL